MIKYVCEIDYPLGEKRNFRINVLALRSDYSKDTLPGEGAPEYESY
jgi:hypothetical protein